MSENEENKRGRGRPRKNGKGYPGVSTVRFDPNEAEMLEYLQGLEDKSKSEIVRNALRTYYYMKKNPDFFRST